MGVSAVPLDLVAVLGDPAAIIDIVRSMPTSYLITALVGLLTVGVFCVCLTFTPGKTRLI